MAYFQFALKHPSAFSMNSRTANLFLLLVLLFSAWSCTESLTNEQIESLDLRAIEDYVAQKQLSGEYTNDNIFISILDSGDLSLSVDSLIQIDTAFSDTFYLDTTFVDSIFVVDTILIDTQYVEYWVPDTSYFYDHPSSGDTILISLEISDLDDQLIFTTNGEIFRRESGLYPTLTQLVSGLRKSLSKFSAGGRGIVIVPSEEAYGRVGNGENLGSNTPLRIDFELIDYR